jgi:hypothetical protein
MKEQFASALGIGLLAVAVAVGAILYMQRGAHVDLTGAMSVHTIATDPNTSLAVIEMHITNPSDYEFEVANVTVTLENAKGDYPTTTIGKVDSKRVADAMPEAGPFHPTLYTKAVLPAHSSGDYTLLAQYSAPQSILDARKQLKVSIQEINGRTAEFSEK